MIILWKIHFYTCNKHKSIKQKLEKRKTNFGGIYSSSQSYKTFCFVFRFLLFVKNKRKSLIIKCPSLTAKNKKNSLLGKKKKFYRIGYKFDPKLTNSWCEMRNLFETVKTFAFVGWWQEKVTITPWITNGIFHFIRDC